MENETNKKKIDFLKGLIQKIVKEVTDQGKTEVWIYWEQTGSILIVRKDGATDLCSDKNHTQHPVNPETDFDEILQAMGNGRYLHRRFEDRPWGTVPAPTTIPVP